MKRTRIILADDHTMLMDAVRSLLEPEYEVVGTFANGEELVRAAERLAPDVVILDVCMPTLNGLTACARLRTLLPKVKVIFLTMNQDAETAGEAHDCGGLTGCGYARAATGPPFSL